MGFFALWAKFCTFAEWHQWQMSLIDRQMKGLMSKICAMLLVLWYCMSIVGFDMHVCKASGRTYVTTFAEGTTCEDIHPEHHCRHDCHHESSCCHHESSCCHQESDCCSHHGHESAACVDSEKCCTDTYQVIVLTGCRAEDEDNGFDSFGSKGCPASYVHSLYAHESLKYRAFHRYKPYSGIIVPCDHCVAFGVWRI